MAESSSSNSNNGSSSPVKRIPQDHLFSILLLLPIESILSFSMTCKKVRSLANSDSLWESVCRRDWGNGPFEALKTCNDLRLPWKKLYQQVYELDSVFCRRLLAVEESVPTSRASHSLNLVSGCLVLFGGGCTGGRHLDDTWVAYTGTDLRTTLKWQKMNSGIPSGRFGHSCVVVGEHLVLFGGINDNGVRQTDTWIGQVTVDSKHRITMTWRLLDVGSISPPPRGAHAACCIGDRRMLVHGGIGPSARRLDDMWILELSEDLCHGIWKKVVAQPCPSSRSGHTLTHIGGMQTILFGGRGMGYEVLNDVWLLDASDDHWRWAQLLFELRNVPHGVSLPRVGHSANLIIGRRLLIYGGEDSYRHRKDDFWVLDVSSMQQPRILKQNRLFRRMWKRLESKGDKPDSRSFHGACVDDSGRFLYIHGGMIDGLIQPADSSGLRFDGESFVVDLLHQP
ncbi:Kelch repeat-containing F-box family protein [Perilla frutescens var. hirtella]|nr:Kelch repeat-containing F-box family protein [Perilla frutescens var. frutescens]KAH6793364.1 Kelch repeat-containing F-box family protein [Perilla frutescens var. hirtella]